MPSRGLSALIVMIFFILTRAARLSAVAARWSLPTAGRPESGRAMTAPERSGLWREVVYDYSRNAELGAAGEAGAERV